MIDAALKKSLRARANTLKSTMSVGKSGVSEPVIAGIRQLLSRHELIKIRVLMDEADDAELAGLEIAQRVPCEFIGRVGRVLILYRAEDNSDTE